MLEALDITYNAVGLEASELAATMHFAADKKALNDTLSVYFNKSNKDISHLMRKKAERKYVKFRKLRNGQDSTRKNRLQGII